MVSEYLKQSCSLDDLDKLIEHDREIAAKIAKTVFNREVTTAITNIGEISQIANARIQADCQVSAAKMMTDAEVTATVLMSKAELAALEIQQQTVNDPLDDVREAMIKEISLRACEAISENAQKSVEDIQREADDAIGRLKDNAIKAIEEIQSLADTIAAKVQENAKLVEDNLRNDSPNTRDTREPEDVVDKAALEAQIILDEAHRSAQELHRTRDRIISDMNALVDIISKQIKTASHASENRIIEAQEKALARVLEIVVRPAT